MSGINGHQFNIDTIHLQATAVQSALEKAASYKNNDLTLTAAKSGRFARKICNDVYKDFKHALCTKFSSSDYDDLISLTLESRTNFFFLDLKNRLKTFMLDSSKPVVDLSYSNSAALIGEKEEEKG